MLALAALLLSCHTSVCLGALLNATHTPHNAGPRAMSRNTRQAMLDGIDRKRKRGYKGKPASYTCDGGGGGGGGGGDRRMSRSKEASRHPVGGPVGPAPGPARPVVRPVDRRLDRIGRLCGRLTGVWTGLLGIVLSLSCSSRKPRQNDQIEGKRWNWRLKVGEIVDQAQQHQIHGPKPLKTQPNHRSVKRHFRAIFWKIF